MEKLDLADKNYDIYVLGEKLNEIIDELNGADKDDCLFAIIDCEGNEMPRRHDGNLRTFEQAEAMTSRLNRDGEYKPYRMFEAN